MRRKKAHRGEKPANPHVPPGFSTPVLKHFKLENPLAGLSDEQKKEMFGLAGREASEQFDRDYTKLESLVRRHNPHELLATASFYCLCKPLGSPEDLTIDGPYPQAVVELLQSVCLRISLSDFGETPMLHGYMHELLELAKSVTEAFPKRQLAQIESADDDQRRLHFAVECARIETQVVRNWAHPQHLRRIVTALFEPIEEEIRNAVGVGPLKLLALFDAFMRRVEDRATEYFKQFRKVFRRDKLKDVVREFCILTGTDRSEEEQLRRLMKSRPGPLNEKRFFLLSYFHHYLPGLFVFSIDECKDLTTGIDAQALQLFLDSISFDFGDLAGDNREHLVMQSKIRSRPLIKAREGGYFAPIPMLLHSFFIEIAEALIGTNERLKARYHKRRAVFLEEQIVSLATKAMPGCFVRGGTVGEQPIEGLDFENDCLVVAGPFALVFEGKSERVADQARRGANFTLRKNYKTLVDEPAAQAERFAAIIEKGSGPREFRTRWGDRYVLDQSKTRRTISISVTLDSFPAATLCWSSLKEAGLVKDDRRPSITLSLADLLVIFDALDTPEQLVHYFWRRIEWEEHVRYFGDEEDLLVYYLSEGMCVQPALRDGKTSLMLHGRSDELRRYYCHSWADPKSKVPRPKRLMTDWWESLLRRVSSLSLEQRWDIASILLDVNYEGQKGFEDRLRATVDRVRSMGNDCGENGVLCVPPLSESKAALIGFAYKGSTEKRNAIAAEMVDQAREETGATRILVLGRSVERLGDPYDVLILSDNSKE